MRRRKLLSNSLRKQVRKRGVGENFKKQEGTKHVSGVFSTLLPTMLLQNCISSSKGFNFNFSAFFTVSLVTHQYQSENDKP